MYFGIVLKVRAHAHDASNKPRTNAGAANELMLTTPFFLTALPIRLIGFGNLNTGGMQIRFKRSLWPDD